MKVKLQQLIQENQGKLATTEGTGKPKKKKRTKKPKKLKPLKQNPIENVAEETENMNDEVGDHNESMVQDPMPVLVSPKKEVPKIDEKLLYAKFKNESDWLKAVLKERKASLSGASNAATSTHTKK